MTSSLETNWANIATVGCLIIAAFIEAWQQAVTGLPTSVRLFRLQGSWHYVPLALLLAAGVVWLIGRAKRFTHTSPQTTAKMPGIPSLSALLGMDPDIEFDAKKFFALAYYSPVTAEAEQNIKVIAQRYAPDNKEAFYARFIGIGLVAYQHDTTWYAIFGSQLQAMMELSARGVIPIADLKKYYDKAAVDFPQTYISYSFEQWLSYLKERSLIATYPSQMVELSFNGKDFLRYLAHLGRNIASRLN